MKQIKDESVDAALDALNEVVRKCKPVESGWLAHLTAYEFMKVKDLIAELENTDPVPDLELLKDPTAVGTMIMRGTIAKPAYYERMDPQEYAVVLKAREGGGSIADPATGEPEAADYSGALGYGVCMYCAFEEVDASDAPCVKCKSRYSGTEDNWRSKEEQP